MQLLQNQLGDKNILQELGRSVGASPKKTSKLTQLGLPAALDQHQDDSADDLSLFFRNVDAEDGKKILQHVFADKNTRIQNNLAKKNGLNSGQVGDLLSKLAPLVLGALGNQKKAQNLDASGIAGLLPSLSGLLGGGGNLSGITKLLDADQDGDIMDDIKGFLGKLGK